MSELCVACSPTIALGKSRNQYGVQDSAVLKLISARFLLSFLFVSGFKQKVETAVHLSLSVHIHSNEGEYE